MFNFKEAEATQNKIYQRMSASKKIKIAGQLFLLGQKLNAKDKEKNNKTGRPSLRNR
jgi:hypothetical protein